MRDNGQKKNGKKGGRTWRADRARYQPACHHTCTVHTCTGTSACLKQHRDEKRSGPRAASLVGESTYPFQGDRAASLRRIFPCSSVGQLAVPVSSSRNVQQQVVDNSTPRVSNGLLPVVRTGFSSKPLCGVSRRPCACSLDVKLAVLRPWARYTLPGIPLPRRHHDGHSGF
ncbi:hypothetical protein HDV57DRAFT_72878 [Trichoderma longibrachiatum]|uniref:Uncharacterized protein n=1 Tax=Trichoderma longibrachiatum ATCC 18648 TaxID=983965 RepID=A0A2T4BUP7_TRILO|nr:hypothetical protein M440DRAFT_1071117 [Trichoderma longibrachiatum ATCC 18648]